MAHYSKALQLDPNNAETSYKLANALVQNGRLEEALKYYYNAVRLDPNNAATHDRLSKVLRQLGRFDEADAQARQALEANSSR